ncbi:MAG: V-type ATP synthase subunit D [Ruminococcaceae bacterium]|nr:V-type ATP synthase subunit D [Oscillospiraceae bacterium]
MEIRVNPTRMELKKLQARYATARRGHKLLKDKCDGLMQQFLEIVREARRLRAELEPKLTAAYASFAAAGAVSDPKMLQTALLLPRKSAEVDVTFRNRMSVNVPQFSAETGGETELCNYGFAFTGGSIDAAILTLSKLREPMLRMAQLEKEAMLMADEIERTRRRVNALEHIMIPQYLAGIRQIKLKLDENERGNITRLMKVKDMMLAAQMQQRKDFIPDESDAE